ncbi:uncharacterized protein LOC135212737 isoform X2 [Macrobrachium nipponense]|uniref:uncharacterized protein LOC135212737 isoform X2 n=1 Tax=Macrobrachium nipponense TaxID=159736 RepID=UPI0030C815BF
MLLCATTIIPSIHKNLEFITAIPKVSLIGGLHEVKQQLEEIFIHHANYAEAYDNLNLKRPKDGIFRSRDGKTSSNVNVSILNELLQAMDGANMQATTLQGVSFLSSNLSRSKV